MTNPFLVSYKKRDLVRIIVSSIIFVLASVISAKINIYNTNIVKINPQSAIPPVLGLYFGTSGALGVGIGSVIQNILSRNYNIKYIMIKSVVEFFYAYVPYKLWYTFNIKDKCDIPNLNNIKSIFRYIFLILIDFIAVYIMNEFINGLFNNNAVDFGFLVLNMFNDFNYVIMIGVAAVVAISTTNIRPDIPKSTWNIRKSMHYEFFIYTIIILDILGACYFGKTDDNNIMSYIVAFNLFLMIVFIFMPIGNKANIVEISKTRGVFSLKGKITIGFLIFSVVFTSVLAVVTHLAFNTTVYAGYTTYKKINILIGLSGYFVFAITLLVLQYVQNKITNPIQILFNAVEGFTRKRYEKNINDEELIKQCDSIKTGDEIEELAIAFGKMMRDMKDYVKNLSTATARIEKEAAELAVARKIQESMLPSKFPENDEFEIYASINPAKEVSGDFYDFFIVNENYLVFLIADVSGKGVPAALFMMTAKTTIKNLLNKSDDISDVISKVNNALCENNDTLMFVTAFIAVVDLNKGIMTYVNAGHNPPLIRRANGEFDYMNVKNNCILAIMPNAEFEEQIIKLQNGDMLFAYTDGITEAINSEGDLFGIERLKESLNREVNEFTNVYNIVPLVEDNIAAYRDGEEQNDDITMIVFKYHGKNE